MKRYLSGELKAKFAELGYTWPEFHLIGIRSQADKPNEFDDWIVVVSGENLFHFHATTNPGATYLQKLLNPKGAAVLKPGQYVNTWAFGLHRGKYEALKQVRPVTVWRDADRDLKSESGAEDTGLFGINIHKAGTGVTKYIGGHSAGCQVFADEASFNSVMKMCKATGLKQFTYTLLNEF